MSSHHLLRPSQVKRFVEVAMPRWCRAMESRFRYRASLAGAGILLLLAASLLPGAASANELSFVENPIRVSEGVGMALVEIQLVRSPDGLDQRVTVDFQTDDDTATYALDYWGMAGTLVWEAGEDGIRSFEVPIIDDTEPEGTEIIKVSIGQANNATYSVWIADLWIEDDEPGSGLAARITFGRPLDELVLPCSYPGPYYFEGGALAVVDMCVGHSQDVEALFPMTLEWRSDFVEGPQLLYIDSTSPNIEFGRLPMVDSVQDGWIHLPPQDGLSILDEDVHHVQMFILPVENNDGDEDCALCVIATLLMQEIGGQCPENCDFDCTNKQGGTSGGLNTFSILRSYRDDILMATEESQRYAAFYDQIKAPVLRAVISRPSLIFDFDAVQQSWMPGFDSLVNDTKSDYVITQQMQIDLDVVMAALYELTEPFIAYLLQEESDKLGLDNLVGLTMGELQQRLESPNGVPTKRQSWGTLKSGFSGN